MASIIHENTSLLFVIFPDEMIFPISVVVCVGSILGVYLNAKFALNINLFDFWKFLGTTDLNFLAVVQS